MFRKGNGMSMYVIPVLAQVMGIIGMFFNIFCFQCKKKNNLVIAQSIGSSCFVCNYLLIGGYTSAGMNVINIVRSVSIVNKKTHNNIFFLVICLLSLAMAVITYSGIWTIVLMFSQLAMTFAMWYKDNNFIRILQFFFVSPVWLINNVFFSFSIGGIICEIFTMISVMFAFIRFRKMNVQNGD